MIGLIPALLQPWLLPAGSLALSIIILVALQRTLSGGPLTPVPVRVKRRTRHDGRGR